jgi:hypothetical protein
MVSEKFEKPRGVYMLQGIRDGFNAGWEKVREQLNPELAKNSMPYLNQISYKTNDNGEALDVDGDVTDVKAEFVATWKAYPIYGMHAVTSVAIAAIEMSVYTVSGAGKIVYHGLVGAKNLTASGLSKLSSVFSGVFTKQPSNPNPGTDGSTS